MGSEMCIRDRAGSNNAEATLDQIHKEDAMDLQAKQSRMNGLFESAE